jgi:hypothetical protein
MHLRFASRSALVAALAVVCAPAPARATDKEECIQDHAAGQRLRRGGALRSAREKFVACARGTCPSILQRECSEWLAEVESAQPTVVIFATRGGAEIASARVFVDGEVLADRLTGLSLAVDPGERTFRIVTPDGTTSEEHVVVREGEKLRTLTFELPTAPRVPPPPPPKVATEGGLPVAVYALGAVALAGFAGFTTLGLVAKAKADGFESCRPTCDAGEVATMRREALFADISLGVGLVSLGAMIWILATRPTDYSRVRGLGSP